MHHRFSRPVAGRLGALRRVDASAAYVASAQIAFLGNPRSVVPAFSLQPRRTFVAKGPSGGSSGIFGDLKKKADEEEAAERAAEKAAAAAAAEEETVFATPPPQTEAQPEPGPAPGAGRGDAGSRVGTGGSPSPPRPPRPPPTAPLGGVDQELWDVLLELHATPHGPKGKPALGDPRVVGDCLAENSVFAIEDLVCMPNYRLGSYGVDARSRRALGRWAAANGGDPFEEEEEEEEAKGEEGAEEAKKDGEGEPEKEGGGDAAKEGDDAAKGEAPQRPPIDWAGLAERAPGLAAAAWADVRLSLSELFTLDKDESVLRNKIHAPVSRAEGTGGDGSEGGGPEGPAQGPEGEMYGEVMAVKQQGSAWDRLRARLSEAPLFQEIYRRAREAQKTQMGQEAEKAKAKLSDKVEDAREAWETSQNPWVYRLSEVWDSLTHETDTGIVLKELRKLDPNFSLEVWRENMRDVLVPTLLSAWLRGDKATLAAWCKPDVLEKLGADMAARKKERIQIDANVLSIDHAEVIVDPSMTEKAALIGLFVAAQQIHCVRDHNGDIVEGGEDHLKSYRYLLVFQREYVPEAGELQWKLADFASIGSEEQMI